MGLGRSCPLAWCPSRHIPGLGLESAGPPPFLWSRVYTRGIINEVMLLVDQAGGSSLVPWEDPSVGGHLGAMKHLMDHQANGNPAMRAGQRCKRRQRTDI